MGAVALRQSTDLDRYDPQRGADTVLVAEAAEKRARRMRDNEALAEAVDLKIDGMIDFIGWWDTRARKDAGGDPRPEARTGLGLLDKLEDYGLTPRILKRWKTSLCVKRDNKLELHDAKVEDYRQRCKQRNVKVFEPEQADTETGGAVSLSTGFYNWYTPHEYIESVRQVLGSIDLDPASCASANAQLVKAQTFYSEDDDGLGQSWAGRVYCNPPYRMPDVQRFAEKLAGEYSAGKVEAGIFLVHNASDANWWQDLACVADAIAFPRGRINFVDGRTMAVEPGSSIRGQSLFYLGPDRAGFVEVFGARGVVLVRSL